MRSITRRPSLAKYVKRFTANALLGYCTDISMGMINEDDWGNIKSELKKITYTSRGERCSPFTEKIESNFLPMIEAGNWDALVGLLVSLLPNLEEINIVNHASGCPYGYPYLETVLLRAAALQCTSTYEPYALSKLHTVRLAKHDAIHHPRMGFEFLRIFPFLSLPSVRNYDLQNGDRENMHFDLKPSVLAASIQHLSQTLQTLRITQKRLRQPPKLHTNDGQSSFPPLSSLSNFTQLEVLDVSAHLVFGDDETISSDGYLEALSRLPDSVQTLVLRDSVRDNDISATSQLFYPDIFVKTIVGDWNGWRRPKGLQSMELHFRKSARNESTILRWEEYEDLCRKLGLNLRRGEDRGAVRNHHGESQGEQHDVGCDDCDAHKKLGKIQMERSDDWMTTIAITEEPGMQEVTNAGKPNLMPRTTTAS
ncbi:hypothetical protein ACMFMF_010042 [Clarireedia jacksonii]